MVCECEFTCTHTCTCIYMYTCVCVPTSISGFLQLIPESDVRGMFVSLVEDLSHCLYVLWRQHTRRDQCTHDLSHDGGVVLSLYIQQNTPCTQGGGREGRREGERKGEGGRSHTHSDMYIVYTCTLTLYLSISLTSVLYIYLHVHVHAYTCTCTCTCIYMHIPKQKTTCTCTCTYVYMYNSHTHLTPNSPIFHTLPTHPLHSPPPPTLSPLSHISPLSSVFLRADRLWKVRAEMCGRPHLPPSTSSSNLIHLTHHTEKVH